MFERILKWRKKVLKRPDSTKEEVKTRCEATYRVSGVFHNYDWRLVLMYCNGDSRTEIADAAARFNKDALGKTGLVAFHLDDARLDEYLRRCQANADYVAKGGRPQYAPFSYEELAMSPVWCGPFNLEDITSAITFEEDREKNETGYLSKNPTLLHYGHGANHYKVFIKIDWVT